MATYYNKLFSDLDSEERNSVEGKYFICMHPLHYYGDIIGYRPYFEYLVIYDREFISRFTELDRARDYVDWMNSKS